MYEQCRFCTEFYTIPKKNWTENNRRQCPIVNKLVSMKDGCGKLTLVSHIHCIGWNQRIAVEVCLNNAKTKKYTKCVRCKLSKQLILLYWKLNRQPKPIIKPIVKKHRSPIVKEKNND